MTKALVEIAQVLHYGKLKYSRGNWLKGLKKSELRQAQKRHEMKYDEGQQRDEESFLFHLAHKACLSLMELELYMRNNLLDDDGDAYYLLPIQLSVEEMFTLRFNN